MARMTAGDAVVSDDGQWYHNGLKWKPLVDGATWKPGVKETTSRRADGDYAVGIRWEAACPAGRRARIAGWRGRGRWRAGVGAAAAAGEDLCEREGIRARLEGDVAARWRVVSCDVQGGCSARWAVSLPDR